MHGLSKAQAKTRYRQLIGLFHPDRGAQDPAWLTYRAERINTAYSRFIEALDAKSENTNPPKPEPTSAVRLSAIAVVKPKLKTRRRVILPFSTRDLRKWLGSPEKFEKHVFIGLIGLAAFIVTLLLLSALVS